MKHKFTEEDIIRFLYNEMSIRESEAFLDALYTDDQLWETFESYQHIVDKLIRMEVDPSDETCNNIMRFVADTHPDPKPKQKSSGNKQNQLRVMMMGVLVLVTSMIVTGSIYFFQEARQKNQQAANMPVSSEQKTQMPLEWEDPHTEQTIQSIRQQLDDIKEDTGETIPDDTF